jgi:hypothetical protein
MVQSLTGKNVVSKSATVFTVRMCSLFLLLFSVLLLTGCANLSSDDREIFYSGWANPNSSPRTQ